MYNLHCLILEHFHRPQKKPHTHSEPCPTPQLQCLVTANLLSFYRFVLNILYKWIIQHAIFCYWLLSLSAMFLRFTHIVAHIRTHSCVLPSSMPLCGHTTFCLSLGVHLGCSPFLAIKNNAAINIDVEVYVWT